MFLRHAETVALRKLAPVSEGFDFVSYEHVGTDAVKLVGAVPRLTKAGKKKWPAERKCQVAIVTQSEIDAERARYEAETGLCAGCMGECIEFMRWSHDEGTFWRPCSDCCGTGEAKR